MSRIVLRPTTEKLSLVTLCKLGTAGGGGGTKVYDTESALLATIDPAGTLAYAIDTRNFWWRRGAQWAPFSHTDLTVEGVSTLLGTLTSPSYGNDSEKFGRNARAGDTGSGEYASVVVPMPANGAAIDEGTWGNSNLISLTDPRGTTWFFIWDSDGSVTPDETNRPLVFTPADTADQLRDTFIAAVNASTTPYVASSGGAGAVRLTPRYLGVLWNLPVLSSLNGVDTYYQLVGGMNPPNAVGATVLGANATANAASARSTVVGDGAQAGGSDVGARGFLVITTDASNIWEGRSGMRDFIQLEDGRGIPTRFEWNSTGRGGVAGEYASGYFLTTPSYAFDGGYVEISDGTNAVSFVLDQFGVVTPTPTVRPIAWTGTETADQLRDLFITAINAARGLGYLQVAASNGGTDRVDLVNDIRSPAGNVPIGTDMFNVFGMDGGIFVAYGDPTHNIAIPYMVSDTAIQLAAKLVTAVNSATDLFVTASDAGAGRVDFLNTTPGGAGFDGNVLISLTQGGMPPPTCWIVVGMFGGGVPLDVPDATVIGALSLSQSPSCTILGNQTRIGERSDRSIAIGQSVRIDDGSSESINLNGTLAEDCFESIVIGGEVAGEQAVAIGRRSNAASPRATAVGFRAVASTAECTACGFASDASGAGSTAIGAYSSAAGNSVSLGRAATYTPDCVVAGYQAYAGGQRSVVIGSDAEGPENNVVAGYDATSHSIEAIAIGSGSQVGFSSIGAIAIGKGASASHAHSGAIGYNAQSTAARRITLGKVGGTADEIRALQVSGGFGMAGVAPTTQLAHVPNPTGGAVVDTEGRSAINSILTALEAMGLLATV